jgi:hypothetical protein
MRDFIIETKKKVTELELEGKYCIVVYTHTSISRNVKYIYKNIEDFETKIENDIASINSMYSIDFQMWIFN